MRDLDSLFEALGKSAFRRRLRVGARELAYLHGEVAVLETALAMEGASR
ncbi:hypothetical protein AWB65_00871 [Caballeronia humi]|uniref:Uncharacterized protein n=1 Tax=Caballeronia humi TaxID=326474 RepID=A0A158FHR0_9BURK|nr:hypothetical protein AWB65_00871 [Caballeronia humi]